MKITDWWEAQKMQRVTGIGSCPAECDNKTDLGYCKTTGCIKSGYVTIRMSDLIGMQNEIQRLRNLLEGKDERDSF